MVDKLIDFEGNTNEKDNQYSLYLILQAIFAALDISELSKENADQVIEFCIQRLLEEQKNLLDNRDESMCFVKEHCSVKALSWKEFVVGIRLIILKSLKVKFPRDGYRKTNSRMAAWFAGYPSLKRFCASDSWVYKRTNWFSFSVEKFDLRSNRKPRLPPETWSNWSNRFQESYKARGVDGVLQDLELFYQIAGQHNPVEFELHDYLSLTLLGEKSLKKGLLEVEKALAFAPGDASLIHRKALFLVEMGDLEAAQECIQGPALRWFELDNFEEVLGLQARIHREKYTKNPSSVRDLYAALHFYKQAYETSERTRYYSGGQAVVMAMLADDTETVNSLIDGVIDLCNLGSTYWAFFTKGEMLLIKGMPDEALGAYQKGLELKVQPTLRERDSAYKGALRVAKKCSINIEKISKLLKPACTAQPIDTSEIKIPPSFSDLREVLAKNAHENLAIKQMNGEDSVKAEQSNGNGALRDMISYEDLPEEEKEYGRRVATDALKIIYAMGYEIRKK